MVELRVVQALFVGIVVDMKRIPAQSRNKNTTPFAVASMLDSLVAVIGVFY